MTISPRQPERKEANEICGDREKGDIRQVNPQGTVSPRFDRLEEMRHAESMVIERRKTRVHQVHPKALYHRGSVASRK